MPRRPKAPPRKRATAKVAKRPRVDFASGGEAGVLTLIAEPAWRTRATELSHWLGLVLRHGIPDGDAGRTEATIARLYDAFASRTTRVESAGDVARFLTDFIVRNDDDEHRWVDLLRGAPDDEGARAKLFEQLRWALVEHTHEHAFEELDPNVLAADEELRRFNPRAKGGAHVVGVPHLAARLICDARAYGFALDDVEAVKSKIRDKLKDR